MNHAPSRINSSWAYALIACWFVVGIIYVIFGFYVGDEGWYCLISREVWNGRALYSDIRFTQMPLLPYVYGAWLYFLPARIESARALSLLLGLAGVLLLWRILQERYGVRAAFIALLLALLNITFAIDITNARTQALTFFLTTICVFGCHRASLVSDETHRTRHLLFAAVIAGLSVTARLSMLPLCIAPALLALTHAQSTLRSRTRQALLSMVSACALPLAVGIYFYLSAGDRFLFCIAGFHALLGDSLQGAQLGFVAQFARNIAVFAFNTLPWTLTLAISIAFVAKRFLRSENKREAIHHNTFEISIAMAWAAITFIHVTRSLAYPTYQTPIVWAPVIFCAWCLQRWFEATHPTPVSRRYGLALAGTVLISLSQVAAHSPGLFLTRERRPAGIYDMATTLRDNPGKTLVTFEAGLAFCAPQIKLPQGYEMAEFSLVPPMPEERQEYFRGVTFRKLKHDAAEADFIALRNMDFSHLSFSDSKISKTAWQKIQSGFVPVQNIESYGQYGSTITLHRRR